MQALADGRFALMLPLCLRWTVGDVSPAGFEALRLSVHGARQLFGSDATYVICVNTLPLEEAKRRAGPMPDRTSWRAIDRAVPDVLKPYLKDGMTEGTGWKLIPLQLGGDVRELALDNDVILWDLPEALAAWLADESGTAKLIAADVTPAHGQFAALCGSEPRNSGIRGTPAGFDFESAIAAVLRDHPAELASELDEQGLQIAAMSLGSDPLVVTTREVAICSPFYPHEPELGSCGAHFVGLNARDIPWTYYDRPAIEVRLEHWQRHRPALYQRAGLTLPDDEAGIDRGAA